MPSPRGRAFEPWLQLLVAVVAVALMTSGQASIGTVRLVTIGAGMLVMMAAAWPPAVGWRPLPVGRVLLAYVPFALLWWGLLIGYLQLMHAIGHPVAPQPMLQELATQGVDHPQFALLLSTIVLAGPAIEELLFRGYLFTALAGVLPNAATQLVTAALFGLAHGAGYALPIGVLALLFGWLRQRYQALLPSMFAHMVHNFLTVLITVAWPGHLQWLYPQ